MSVDPDYYAVLGLKPGCSLEEVKDNYRRLAKVFHPDLNNNDPWCQEQITELNIAYEYLLNPARKAAYDARFRFSFGPAHREESQQESPPEESRPPHPNPPGLRPLRFVFAGGRSFVVSAQVLLGAAFVPLVIGLFFFFGLDTAFLGVIGGDRVGASSGVRPPAIPEAEPVGEVSHPLPGSLPLADSGEPAHALSAAGSAPGKNPVQDLSRAADLSAPLLARCSAALPRTDALITLGDRAYGANENLLSDPIQTADSSRRAAVLRLAQDLSAAKTQRVLIYADMERLQWVQSQDEMQQVIPPIQHDLRSLTASLRPVQADIHTLKSVALPSHVLPVHLATPVRDAAPFRALPPADAAPKLPANPHLSSPSADEPQFSMPAADADAPPVQKPPSPQ